MVSQRRSAEVGGGGRGSGGSGSTSGSSSRIYQQQQQLHNHNLLQNSTSTSASTLSLLNISTSATHSSNRNLSFNVSVGPAENESLTRIFNGKGNNGAVEDQDQEEDEDEINLADICEVVLSLKCKQCEFLCNDKDTLALHIRSEHSKPKRKKTVPVAASALAPPPPTPKEEPVTITLISPPHPHPPPAQSQLDNQNDADVNANIHDHDDSSMDDDVFLCAECDIVFSSREVCCSHMHKVHGLKQFSADFIQEEIISKPRINNEEADDEESQSMTSRKTKRKTKLPKQFTADAGTIVSKKYRVTKDVLHSCSKCPIKFQSAEVMKFHEQCHLPTAVKNKKPKSSVVRSGKNGKKKNSPVTMIPEDSDGVGVLEPEAVVEKSGALKGFMCPVCESNGKSPFLFPKWSPCAWHLWKEHRIDCELYTCSICKQFKSYFIARVKDHEQLHSAQASYKCKTCNKTFKQMKQLRCHEKYHKDHSTKLAPVEDSRWYTPKECHICKRILSDSKCLKKHISAVHNKLKPYVCNICGHTSARKAELQLHVRQHTGEKPYKCPMCSFQTGDHNSLRKHKLRHSDERPYACPYCDYRCIQSCAFKKHLLSCHPGQEVVFLCQLCSHETVNEANFIAHQKDHTEGRIPLNKQDDSETMTSREGNNSKINSTGIGSDKYAASERICKEKYWSSSADEDSVVDVVDNGGVTIPASPQEESSQISAGGTGNAIVNVKGEKVEVERSESGSEFEPESEPPEPEEDEAMILPPIPISPPTPTFIIIKGEDHHHVAADSMAKRAILVGRSVPGAAATFSLSPSPQHPFTLSASTPQIVVQSPRHFHHQDVIIRGCGNSNEDTESSTSEAITNPHQLIQNIQITPLDLTDIISSNDHSNDDGMLQRLLDMSGV